MKDGQTVKLTVEQLLAIMVLEVFGTSGDFPEALTTELGKKLNKTGGTLTGNLFFQDDSEGVNLSGGSRLYDTVNTLVLLANGGLFRIFNEDATVELLNLDQASNHPKWKGFDLFHANYGNLPLAQIPNLSAAKIPSDLTADKAFRRGNILGAVSKAAGVPSGALIEYGTGGSSGFYVRFADGLQICTASILQSTGANTGTAFTWPAAFNGAPYAFAQAPGNSSSNLGSSYVTEISTRTATGGTAKLSAHSASSILDVVDKNIDIIGIGRWG